MIRFKAHCEGNVIVPDEPVKLPKGASVWVVLEGEPADGKPFWEALDGLADEMDVELPSDLSAQHDHYAHAGHAQRRRRGSRVGSAAWEPPLLFCWVAGQARAMDHGSRASPAHAPSP